MWPDRGRPALGRPARGRRGIDVNPFEALEVQMALGRLESLVDRFQVDDGRFARAHHLQAARAAYDRALDEACRLAGVADLPAEPAVRRVLAEAELRSRGWSW
jgi:hypothetical protein